MLSVSALSAFSTVLHGHLVQPGDTGYDAARQVYNGMIDRRPRLIVYARDVADVQHTVRLASDHQQLLALRGGGHNGGGLGVCDDGVVLDMSLFKAIEIDPAARTARVGAGCLLREIDAATHAHGLALPMGINGTTGIAGLTLGGGIGYLSRQYGLTVDHLLSADVVLASGEAVTASANEHPDLFWALRGGGGNFGVVTTFEFRLEPVRDVVGGMTIWPIERMTDLLRWYREFIVSAPPDLNGFVHLGKIPPVDPFPAALHGRTVCAVVWCYTGPPEQAGQVFAPIRAFGPPMIDAVQPMPMPMLQGMFDALYPAGLQWYWRGDFFDTLSDEAIARHVEFAARVPTLHSLMHLYPVLGQVHAVGPNETAFSYRRSQFAQVVAGVSHDPADRDAITRWCKDYGAALHDLSAGGSYINFLMEEGDARVQAAYRGNLDRLFALKRRYDPGNLFRVNQNIVPA
ncbi:FAD-binding oxidoreductase [uncultured Sphaerotilus sp.]|uniref:FAD-binding oxidoreductase n=1 Tax=uncultured Sphaerotilus sp. TaxID=474984 RepID=UPI0030CA5653